MSEISNELKSQVIAEHIASAGGRARLAASIN